MLKPYKSLHGHYFKVVENKKSTSDKIISLCKVIETDDKINADYIIMKKVHNLRRCPICNSPDCVQNIANKYHTSFTTLQLGDKIYCLAPYKCMKENKFYIRVIGKNIFYEYGKRIINEDKCMDCGSSYLKIYKSDRLTDCYTRVEWYNQDNFCLFNDESILTVKDYKCEHCKLEGIKIDIKNINDITDSIMFIQKYVPRFFFIILLEGDKNKFLYHEFYGSECKCYFGFFLEMVNGYVLTRRRMKN